MTKKRKEGIDAFSTYIHLLKKRESRKQWWEGDEELKAIHDAETRMGA